jgi:glycosyltransferase involved in cell wall biosynthesis
MLVVDGLGLSGKTKALVDLAVGMDRSRFEPCVVCFSTEQSPLASRLRQQGVALLEVPIEERLSFANLWRIIRVVRTLRPDIVHCYNPRAMLYGGLAARAAGIRAVLGSLSAFACMVPDRRYAFLPQKLVTASRRNRIRNRLTAVLVRRLAVVSQRLGEDFCAYNGIARSRLRLVPYGVRAGEPEGSPARAASRMQLRAELGLTPEDIVVGSVGRLVEQKDYPTQLRGFAAAWRVEPRLAMILIGDGTLRAQLEGMAAEQGVAHRVRFLGYRSDVASLLPALDLFALTSKFEPFGIAILEAKAHGVPIVASAVNEIPEILSQGNSGRLFEAASAEGFSQALLELIHDPLGTRSMAAAAYREAQVRHGLQAMIEAYQCLYDEIYAETHVQNPLAAS